MSTSKTVKKKFLEEKEITNASRRYTKKEELKKHKSLKIPYFSLFTQSKSKKKMNSPIKCPST